MAVVVRSDTRSRSNSARTASIRKTILPAAVVVSMASDRLTRSAPALWSFSDMSMASLVLRAKRDRL